MSLAVIDGRAEEPGQWQTADLGAAVAELGARLAGMESRWFALLREFDRREGWRLDGQLSGVDWLVWRCGLSARAAREKLRVAHELRRRPAVAEAFASGSLSYSKVRAITRIADADEETDRWLLRLAESGTAADLERMAHHWAKLAEQERGVDDYLRRFDRRGLVASRTYDGMMVLETVLPREEGEELLATLRAVVDKSVDGGPAEPQTTAQRRADALVDLIRAGRGHLGTPDDTSGADRYTLHLVADIDAVADRFGDHAALPDGTPVSIETVRRLP